MTFDMPRLGSWEERGGWVVRRLMVDAQLLAFQAAGLVGNLGYESAGFSAFHEVGVPEGQGGYGWGQWTSGRRKSFFAWCDMKKLPRQSDEANYGFLLHELRGDYKAFLGRLQEADSLLDATRLTHKDYETPSDVLDGSFRSLPERLQWAKRALEGARGPTPQPDPTPPPPQAPVVKAIDRVMAIQVILDVRPDGDFGPISRRALDNLIGQVEK